MKLTYTINKLSNSFLSSDLIEEFVENGLTKSEIFTEYKYYILNDLCPEHIMLSEKSKALIKKLIKTHKNKLKERELAPTSTYP